MLKVTQLVVEPMTHGLKVVYSTCVPYRPSSPERMAINIFILFIQGVDYEEGEDGPAQHKAAHYTHKEDVGWVIYECLHV